MTDAALLDLLRCPESGQRLRPASPDLIRELEARRIAGTLRDAAGRSVGEAVAEGLVREDGAILFPVRNGIPVMLPDEAITIRG